GEIGAGGVVADRLLAGGLVDADGADAAVGLGEHVAPDPAEVVLHLVALGARARRGGLRLVGRPHVAAQDDVGVHGSPLGCGVGGRLTSWTLGAAMPVRMGRIAYVGPPSGPSWLPRSPASRA